MSAHQRRNDDKRHVPQIEFFPTRHRLRFGCRRNVNSGFGAPRARHTQTVLRQVHQFQFDVRPETFLVELYLAGEPFEVFLQSIIFIWGT